MTAHPIEAALVQVIRVSAVIGQGTHDDPVRRVISWFETDGTPIATTDTAQLTFAKEPLNP